MGVVMRDPSEIEVYLQYGVDFKRRRIYFGNAVGESEVTSESVGTAVRALDRMVYDDPSKPVEIHIASYGGDPYMALGLYDKIQELPCKVEFYGRGAIMSAAVIIMCACDERFLAENATVMLHEGSSDPGERNVTDLAISSEEDTRLNSLICGMLADRTFVSSPDFWLNIARRDLFISPSEALFLGLADRILPRRKRGNHRKAAAHLFKVNKPSRRQLQSIFNKLSSRVRNVDITNIVVRMPVEECEEVQPDGKQEVVQPELGDRGGRDGDGGGGPPGTEHEPA